MSCILYLSEQEKLQIHIKKLQLFLFYIRKELERNELVECKKRIRTANYYFENIIKPRDVQI